MRILINDSSSRALSGAARNRLGAWLLGGATLAVAVASAAPAGAQDRGLVFAGGQLDYADYGSVGGLIALPGAEVGRGLALRGSAFAGDYDYIGGAQNTRISADFKGAQIDAVFQITRRGFWLNPSLGARYTDTDLSPFDPGNRRHGSQVEAVIGGDGGYVSGPWRVDGFASYGTRLEDYSVRVGLTHHITDRLRAGAEVSAEGDPTYDLQRVGPMIGFAIDSRSELQASAGVSHQSGMDEGGYLRLSIYRRF